MKLLNIDITFIMFCERDREVLDSVSSPFFPAQFDNERLK